VTFIFLSLVYFPHHDGLQFHLFSCKWRNFILLDGWIILHWVYVPHFSLSIHWLVGIWADFIGWLLWPVLLLYMGAQVSLLFADLDSLGHMPKSGMAGSRNRCHFNSYIKIAKRNTHTDAFEHRSLIPIYHFDVIATSSVNKVFTSDFGGSPQNPGCPSHLQHLQCGQP
jgi:hypothetical protein